MPSDAFSLNNRRTVRAPINPNDKTTVVSILPFPLDEKKPTMFPGRFIVPAGELANPGILVVGPSSWWRSVGEDEPLLEIPVSSYLVAESIVRDYCNSQLGNGGDRSPGLFFMPGDLKDKKTREDNKAELAAKLAFAEQKQKNWYLAQVKIADVLWARSQGNPLSISNIARHAAKTLQLDKPWMQDFKTMAMENCPACGTLRANQFPVCANCKTIIDKDKYQKLGLSVAV